MKTVFYLDGGAGRIIASIPAFLKFHRNNPNNDFVILIMGWDMLFYGIPELQNRIYSPETKGLFKNVLKDADEFISLEPYKIPQYYRQEISLVEAFDVEINKTHDHGDLTFGGLKCNREELSFAKNKYHELKRNSGNKKIIVFQPYGRGAKRLDNGEVIDEESRSLSSKDYLYLANKLSEKYNVVFFGEQELVVREDLMSLKYQCELRQWIALVQEADYFIGVDSVGQHIARAVNKHGTVIFGSTFPINTSYPDYFNIIENKAHREYSPIRINMVDSKLADRLNDGCMTFTQKDLDEILENIIIDIEEKVK